MFHIPTSLKTVHADYTDNHANNYNRAIIIFEQLLVIVSQSPYAFFCLYYKYNINFFLSRHSKISMSHTYCNKKL